MISGLCFNPSVYPPTGNEGNCRNGRPLWAVLSIGLYSELVCRRMVPATTSDGTTCPAGYTCVSTSNNGSSVCCPGLNGEKAGKCPIPEPGSVGVCASTCQSDSHCDNDLKCCINACGALTCQIAVTALPPVRAIPAPCGTTVCPADMVCVATAAGPQCVPRIKKGRCPRQGFFGSRRCSDDCRSDVDCPGFQKCCPALRPISCGGECTDPQPALTCENIPCAPGQRCVMTPVQCVSPPCFPVPTCLDNN